MKILTFLSFIAMSCFLFAFSGTTDKDYNDYESLVKITVEFKDGLIMENTYTLDQLVDVMALDFEDVFTCTIMLEGGECTVTASTCDLAMAGFRACACAAGHENFCGPIE